MTNNSTRLYMIRHGETEWNIIGKQQGHLNSNLTQRGVLQARQTGLALLEYKPDYLYSSDLGRAMQTAKEIGEILDLTIQTDTRLRERHLGMLQGMTQEELAKEYPDIKERFDSFDPTYALPPDGESSQQRYDRSIICAQDIASRHPGKSIVIVAHGGNIDSFIRRGVDRPLNLPRCYSLCNASINIIDIANDNWKLITWGDIHHLKELGTMEDW
ncbi:MAG: histidine phosphatase family protein [Desulfobulbaceae bacterium]|nr:histidine phosphatase family protein [Desulfobulbaceae bacterium]